MATSTKGATDAAQFVRVPPHDMMMERALLGAILQEQGAHDDALGVGLQAADFYLGKHQDVFAAMCVMRTRSEPVDVLTVNAELARTGLADRVGGVAYLNELWDSTPNTRHAARYAAVVRNKALVRQMITIAHEAAGKGYSEEADFPDMIGEVQSKLMHLATADVRRPYIDAPGLTSATIAEIGRRAAQQAGISGVPSGFVDLDYRITKGFQPGSLVIVGARPAMGKTAFAMNLGANASVRHSRSVAVFSLEMSATDLGLRLLASEAGVQAQSFRSHGYKPSVGEWERIMEASARIERSRLFVDDSTPLRPSEISAKCRQIHRTHGLDLVVVDYLQLMGHDGRIDSREQQIASISRALKLLARDLGVCIIALSQLNRELEKRPDKRPTLSDLRESGAIEQDADMILFLHRPDYYRLETRGAPKGEGAVGATDDKDLAEVIVAKHRSGPTGVVRLAWNRDYTRFDNRGPENP